MKGAHGDHKGDCTLEGHTEGDLQCVAWGGAEGETKWPALLATCCPAPDSLSTTWLLAFSSGFQYQPQPSWPQSCCNYFSLARSGQAGGSQGAKASRGKKRQSFVSLTPSLPTLLWRDSFNIIPLIIKFLMYRISLLGSNLKCNGVLDLGKYSINTLKQGIDSKRRIF